MKIPRDCDGEQLVRALPRLGNESVRQTGSHIQVTTQANGEHHLSIPAHRPLKIGMLSSLLKDVATHHALSVEAVLKAIRQ